MPKILVVIPAYNCAPQIARVLKQFDPTHAKHFSHIAVINNQSTDDTEARAIAALKENPHVSGTVYANTSNMGYGGTLKVGFELGLKEGYDFVLVIHGDDQGHIRDIIPYIEDGSIKNYDCTLGARFHPASTLENYSRFRTWGNRLFNTFFGLVLGKKVLDLGSGLNLYKLSAFTEKDFLKFPNNLTFDYCGLMSHCHRGRRIRFIPISWREDDQISNVKIISQALSALQLLLSYATGHEAFFTRDKMVENHRYISSPAFTQTAKEAP